MIRCWKNWISIFYNLWLFITFYIKLNHTNFLNISLTFYEIKKIFSFEFMSIELYWGKYKKKYILNSEWALINLSKVSIFVNTWNMSWTTHIKMSDVVNTWACKVLIFREGHKNLKISPNLFSQVYILK